MTICKAHASPRYFQQMASLDILAALVSSDCADTCIRVCGDSDVVRAVLANIHPLVRQALMVGCAEEVGNPDWPSAASPLCIRHLTDYVCSQDVALCLFGEGARMGGLKLCLTSASGTLGEQSPPWTVYDAALFRATNFILALVVFVTGFSFACCSSSVPVV